MSYVLADAEGYLDDFTSIPGLRLFRAWASRHGPPLTTFLDEGDTTDPQGLAHALGRLFAKDPELEQMRLTLQQAAGRADAILILSDGV